VSGEEIAVLTGPALLAAALVGIGLRKRFASFLQLMFFMIASAVLAVVLSFASTFTIAWSVTSADLLIILAALVSALVAAGLIVGTAKLARAR
jgi:hypothetical protein